MKRPGLKKASKRVTLHHKYKVAKKVREHNRQERKALKKGESLNKGSRFTKRTRDPGIPVNCPFRDEILAEAQQFKQHQEEEKEAMKERQRRWQKLQAERKSKGFASVDDMLEDAKKKQAAFEQAQREKVEDLSKKSEKSTSAKGARESVNFWRQVNSVIDEADIILHILDARDPEGSRCKKIEQAVANRDDKKSVMILNKIDLIPEASAKAWLKFYRRTVGPCLAFRATTQKQKENLTQKNSSGKLDQQFSGTRAICNYLANYGRKESADGTSKIRTAVTVGVVGRPNVGKSSIINTLKRNRACQVGARPGVTRNLQHILIDSNVKLIDSPGVVLKEENQNSAIGQILLNAKEIGNVEDARQAAHEIINRCGDMEKMAFHYQLAISPEILGNDPDKFLAALAIRKGRLKKGGRPDVNQACKFLVKEWTVGNLSFHTMPPEIEKQADTIATKFSEELDIDAMFLGKCGVEENTEDEMDDGNSKTGKSASVLFKPVGAKQMNVAVENPRKRKSNDPGMEEDSDEDEVEEERLKDLKHLGNLPKSHGRDLSNSQCDTDLKKMMKKRKKALKKSRKEMSGVGDDLSKMMSGTSAGGDDYDFGQDYS